MLPASNRGAGTNIGMPDVCNTPVGPATAPVPYVNVGLHAQAAPFSPLVRVTMMNALNMGSKIPMTTGDEAGSAHPTIKGAGAFTAGNPVVFIEKLPGINLTCPTTGNNMNNPAGAVLVPAVTNVYFTNAAVPINDEMVNAAGIDSALREAAELPAVSRARCFGKVGYFELRRFSFDAPGLALRAIEELVEKGCDRLVIDLRKNLGGELNVCLRLLGDIVAAGEPLLIEEDADGDETLHCARRHPGTGAPRIPITLLVGKHTASAAELFAAVLQDKGLALVVGRPTYGKPTAQALGTDYAGKTRYATVARFKLASGNVIERVVPDVVR